MIPKIISIPKFPEPHEKNTNPLSCFQEFRLPSLFILTGPHLSARDLTFVLDELPHLVFRRDGNAPTACLKTECDFTFPGSWPPMVSQRPLLYSPSCTIRKLASSFIPAKVALRYAVMSPARKLAFRLSTL